MIISITQFGYYFKNLQTLNNNNPTTARKQQ